ncbi:hypothetical protein [Streptomyces sp. HGB0020]|uniref:hypothetical protein n=1 Tax=Streptomyces sp. HGB0020 TaxID=1078086 RepID=UPI00034EAF63|nr:hypothetical protein [Streptomyces sp. HGB0020]EPD69632.1 hypothetical protein HMPREF1211_00178 [Streptomyces sp. HGB0020]
MPELVPADGQHTLTAVSEGRPVASAGWLLRDMSFDGLPRRAAALSGVVMHPTCRDQSIARTLPVATMVYELADLPHPTVGVDLRGLPY